MKNFQVYPKPSLLSVGVSAVFLVLTTVLLLWRITVTGLEINILKIVTEDILLASLLVIFILTLILFVSYGRRYAERCRLSDYSFILHQLYFHQNFEEILKATNDFAKSDMQAAVDREAACRKTGSCPEETRQHAERTECEYWRLLQLLNEYGIKDLPKIPKED